MSTLKRDVVIVGGGPTGMAAAWQLRDQDIVLLEQNGVLGGRLKSLPRADYWLNLGAHLFPATGADSQVRKMFAELGLDTVDVPGSKTAMSLAGKVYTNRRAETYPFTLPLTLRERLQLVRAGLIVRMKVRTFLAQNRKRAGESEPDRRARVARFESHRSFRDLLGRLPEPVDSIFRTASRRVPAEIEALSAAAGISIFAGNWAGKASGSPVNLLGGSGGLGAAVHQRLGDRVTLGATVSSIETSDDGVFVHYSTDEGQFSVSAKHVIVATPAPVARAIVTDLPEEVRESLDAVAYEPFVSMAVLTDETGPMPWDDLYAVLTPGMAFNMVFNHANPLRDNATRKRGGSLMCYAGAELARNLLSLSDDEIEQRFRADLYRVYPQLKNLISEAVVQRWQYGNWYQTPSSDFDVVARYAEGSRNVVHLAGDYFAPVSGSVEDATASGVTVARRVASALLDTASGQR
jgi:oxygen-dependent protoporphyrinogen oxidase